MSVYICLKVNSTGRSWLFIYLHELGIASTHVQALQWGSWRKWNGRLYSASVSRLCISLIEVLSILHFVISYANTMKPVYHQTEC